MNLAELIQWLVIACLGFGAILYFLVMNNLTQPKSKREPSSLECFACHKPLQGELKSPTAKNPQGSLILEYTCQNRKCERSQKPKKKKKGR